MTLLVGVDAWKKGWVAVAVSESGVCWIRAFDALAAVTVIEGVQVMGVDMPIGLPEESLRECDREARGLVGPRRSSVFSVPPRAVLEAESYADARRKAERILGRGVSKQTYSLRPRIFEVEEVARCDKRVIEMHPEVSFAALKTAPLKFNKRTWNGQQERRRLLADAGLVIPERLDAGAGEVPPDDILDAAVIAWSARRYAAGDAQRLPAEPQGSFGMTIWY